MVGSYAPGAAQDASYKTLDSGYLAHLLPESRVVR